jgi:hypothetical protein
VLSELLNAFVRSPRQPTMAQMKFVYASLQQSLPVILASAGSRTPFRARAFKELVSAARDLAGSASIAT